MLSTLGHRWGTLLSDPFEAVQREFDRDFGFGARGNAVQTDVSRYGQLALWEDNEHVYIEMDVPGTRIEDLDLTMEKGQLWIRGERTFPQHDQKRWYDERSYGSFQRVVSLSDTIDPGSIDATLSDGVLYVTLTKKPEHQPHRIEVKCAGSSAKRVSE